MAPAEIGHLLGLSVLEVFRWVFPLVHVFVILAVLVFLRGVVDGRLAMAVVVLFAASIPFMHLEPQLVRQSAAFTCLFLALFALDLRARGDSGARSMAFALIFLVGVVTFHYTVSYFALGLLIAYALADSQLAHSVLRIRPSIRRPTVSFALICFVLVACGLWAFYFMVRLNRVHLFYAADIVKRLTGDLPEGNLIFLAKPQAVLSKGLLATLGNGIQGLLIVWGFLLLLFGRKSRVLAAWTIWGFAMIMYIGASTAIPQLSRVIYPDRIAFFAYATFAVSIGLALRWIGRNFHWFSKSMVVAVLVGLLAVTNALQLPAVLYASDSKVGRDSFIEKPVLSETGFGTSQWVAAMVSNATILSDIKGADVLRPTGIQPSVFVIGSGRPTFGTYLLAPQYMTAGNAVVKDASGARVLTNVDARFHWGLKAFEGSGNALFDAGDFQVISPGQGAADLSPIV